MTARTVAAFDVDGTLTRRDTLLPFLADLVGPGRLARALAVAAVGRPKRDAAKERLLIRLLRGRPDAIRFRLDQQGLDVSALIGIIGSRTRVYEVLRGDRALTLAMIRRLHEKLGIPADILIRESVPRAA